jgi:tyrosyl-tRNA synthetase
MQGWDSVMIKADVELGGTDQTFNNLVGRDLQESEGQPPQIVMIMPILVGTDGTQKMSKSLGNYIGVSEPASEQYGKTMSIPDGLMSNWFRMVTPLPDDRITSLTDPSMVHPREAKDILARSIVEQYHSASDAEKASEDFRKRFAEKQVLEDTELKTIPASALTEGKIGILNLLKEVGFAASTNEAKRLVEGGAVSLDGTKITDFKTPIPLADGQILQAGKRKVCKIRIG